MKSKKILYKENTEENIILDFKIGKDVYKMIDIFNDL